VQEGKEKVGNGTLEVGKRNKRKERMLKRDKEKAKTE
jgi:hypothetical protein